MINDCEGHDLLLALRRAQSVRRVSLQANNLGDRSGKAALVLLRENQRLSLLDLQDNDIAVHLVLSLRASDIRNTHEIHSAACPAGAATGSLGGVEHESLPENHVFAAYAGRVVPQT
jgi:hypothetical protein